MWGALGHRGLRCGEGVLPPHGPFMLPRQATRPNTRRPAAEPPGVPARRAALRLLDATLRRGLPLEGALDAAAAGLPGNDRGLAHALAAAVLRRLPELDALIDGATQQRLPDDAKARFALRLALAQPLVLGTPPHAAISTVLPLVDGGPRRLVHGVFSTVMRAAPTLAEAATLPEAVATRWREAWGEDVVTAAGTLIAAPPPLDLSFADADVTAESPLGESLMPRHRRLVADRSVPELPGFAEGQWWVQDLAASLPARLLGQGDGTVLDLCAAPGGKTLQLAAAGWRVTAVDASAARLERVSESLARTGLNAEIVAADLLDWSPPAPADAVLLDAPCTATGIFRRHPEVLHRVRPRAIAEAAALQARLLARAAEWVRPGGTLVYATCSLEPEEGERQVERFLADRPDYALLPVADLELPAGIAAAGPGWLRTLPGMLFEHGGLDGFFAARLKRAG
jgi:16S rRNA (cytosine967-C5)-methyltransferase